MKRILSAFMAAVCFVMFTGAALAEEESTSALTEKQSEAVALLNDLGILPEITETQALEQITRAEFAEVVVNMVGGADELTSSPRRIYADVMPEDPAAPYIEYLYDKGIMVGYENAEFKPENNITVSEVLKVMIVITGYSAYAENAGGYPDGYYAQAVTSDMLRGVSGKIAENITWADIAEIARNVLETTNYVKTTGFRGGNPIYSSDNDEEFMSYMLDIYRYTGIVEGTGDNMLSGSGDGCGPDNCIIGGETLQVGEIDFTPYLGMKVEVYYRADDAAGDVALHVIEHRDNNVIDISDADISNNTTRDRVEYYTETRTRTANISPDAVFMYNGKRLDVISDEDLRVGNGSLRLISNDGDTNYDVVIIKSYETFVVDKAVSADCVVNLKYDRGSLDLDDDYLTTYYLDGAEADFSSITSGSVLSIAFSRNTSGDVLADVYISNNQVTGTAVSVSTGDRGSVELADGTRYDYTADFANRLEEGEGSTYAPELNAEGTFYIDYFGKLAAYTLSTSSKNYAYVVNCWYDDMEQTGAIKLFTKDGEFKELPITSNVRVNGERTNRNEIVAALEAASYDGKVNQLVIYEEKEDGSLSSLQLAENKTDDETYQAAENEFILSGYPINQNTGLAGNIRFYKNNAENHPFSFIDGQTIHFSIPYKDLNNEKQYRVETKLSGTDVGLAGPIYCYDSGKGGALGAVVSNTQNSTDYNTPVIIDNVLEAVNEDGDPGIMLQFAGGQSAFVSEDVIYSQPSGNWTSFADYTNTTINDLKRGDVVQYIEANGEITQLRVLVRVDDIGEIRCDDVSSIAENGNMVADVVSVSENGRTAVVRYMTNKQNPNNPDSVVEQSMLVNGTTYRYDSEKEEVYSSSSSDLQPGDRILINSFWWSPRLVVIFR